MRTGSGPGWAAAAMLTVAAVCSAQQSPRELVQRMIDNENAAAATSERWDYISDERSGRTGGHLWTERVVETKPGRMRMLLAVDGKPLDAAQQAAERARLDRLRAHPEEFINKEKNTRADEKRMRDLMEVLPKDFLFENVRLSHGIWTLDFVPDPAYKPSGMEERVLHAMAGTLVIDAPTLRLRHMDFHVVHDVSLGFGLLADVHTGTTFVSDRDFIDGHWHTLHVITQVHAKALLVKNVDLTVDVRRREFTFIGRELSVPEAVDRLRHDAQMGRTVGLIAATE